MVVIISMNFKKCIFILLLLIVILSLGVVSANEIGECNVTLVSDDSPVELVDDVNSQNESNIVEGDVLQVSYQDTLQSSDDIIVVTNWDELQYYCAQTDKDYTLKLKENTNFYPSNIHDNNQQIIINNNVKIIGSEGSYFGDASQKELTWTGTSYAGDYISYNPIVVPDNSKIGITLENITFKWILVKNSKPDAIFIQMGGNANNVIKNCIFYNNTMYGGHSCLVYLKKGDALIENCSFINCTTDFGCVSLYDPNSYTSARMTVKDCYFENNFARTEPGCINNCAILTVYNTTFYKNRAAYWAGAIHTHFYASATIYDSNFTDNVAGWNGGALYTYSYLNIYNTVFSGNNCTTNNGGGAIGACKHMSAPHIYVENSLFENNENLCWGLDELSTTGTGRGGAISLMDEGSLEVRNTIFISNSASIGTAISATEAGSYGSPDVIIVNNTFINHTRAGDVFKVRVVNTICNISNNYYLGNSIEFSNLTLTILNMGKEESILQINASLTNPSYYDADILDKTLYDVYVNNRYVKTVNSTVFTLDFGDLDICNVYVIPTISNRKSNEVTLISSREYIFVSKKNGNDTNNGSSRDAPVSTIKRALELAQTCQNIILLDGDYSESNVQINYDVCIKGEGNATLTGETSFTSSSIFILKNLKINNLNTGTFITQNGNNLLISNCIFTNNNALLVYNSGFTSISNSVLLNNSKIINNVNNCVLDYNWWGNTVPDLNISKFATLNLTSDVSALENNQKVNVKAVFYLNDGSKYTNLPNINLDISSINGILNKNVTVIDENVIYTLTAFNDGILTVSYNDINIYKTFEFLKSNPSISLTTNDIMFGDNLTVTVTAPGDAEGNLTVNVGNASQTKAIESTKTIFIFENLKADNYTITLTYSGDKKYISKELTSNVIVNKYESTIKLNISTVNVGEDVILTITITDSSTGNVTLKINNDVQTLILNNSKASYTIKNIIRGDYLITAIYNGDDKYLSSQDSKFIEVDNLNATISITIDDIVYGDTALVQVTLNDNATGSVSATVDGMTNTSDVKDGKSIIKLNNLEAGIKDVIVFYTGDDTYFNKTLHANFTINKAELTFEMSSGDVMIGQDAHVYIKVPAKTKGTFTIGEDIITIPITGSIDYVIYDLGIGNYTYTAIYNGNNYNTVLNTTSFEVREYPTPQWASEGGNTQNTQKSPYETLTNGEIAFVIPFNLTLSGDLVVDSLGNVYLPTQDGIYAFNQTRQLWYFTSTDAIGNLSGIAISRDVIIAPKSGDTLYFINQTTGEKYGSSNIYQGSSLFAPVVTSDATLYIVSEYQYSSEDYKLTIIPYKLWENGGDPTLITIGNTQPLRAPTLNDEIIVIVSDNRLRMIDAKTLQTISIKSANFQPVRPVIGEGNIVYAVLSDSVVAYGSNGVQLWKTKVSGGVGSTLVLDNEQGLYHVNSKGVLYKYDLVDGSQSKFSSLKVTSGVLIDANNNLYFGSNSIFYALDSEGSILWKSDLGSKIIGNPVMDASGLIYVPTENGVAALTYAPLSDPDLKIQVDDIIEGEKATITITWNSQATGIITCNVNGEEITANADDGKITKSIQGLDIGYYDVEASYSGDMRFKPTTVTKIFVVRSADDVANNIQFDGNKTFSFSLNNAEGNLTVKINDNVYSKVLSDGNASLTINDLAPGDYDVLVIYSGDKIYNAANRTFSLSVPKFNVTLNEQLTTENIVSRISVALPSDATGNLTLSVGTKKYTETVTNGNAVIIVDDLPEGNYTVTLTYSGDNNYESVSKTVSITPAKIPVTLDDANVIVKSGTTPKVSVKLADNATGTFTDSIDDGDYSADISEELIISNLEPGNYTGTITYSGDFRYSKASKIISFEVPKIIIGLNETILTENVVSTVSVSLPADASGELTVSVGSNRYTDAARNGVARVVIDDLGEGNYTAVISYSNDAKYESVTKTVELKHTRIPVELNLDILSPCETPEVSLTLNSSATGSLTVNVGGSEFSKDLTNGAAIVRLTGLNPGNYSAVVTYSGDFRYAKAIRTISVEVPKITLDLNDSIYVSQAVDGVLVEVSMPSDASGDIDIQVNGKTYNGSLSNGFTSIDINNLDPGNYTAYLTYSGDSKYDQAVKTISFEVPKIVLQFNDSNMVVSKMVDGIIVDVTLPSDASGSIMVSVNGTNYNGVLTGGVSSVKVTGLSPENWQATVTYSGDDKYESISRVFRFSIGMVEISFNDTTLSVVSPSQEPVVNVQFGSDVTGNITVTVNNKEFHKELTNGRASVVVTGLNPGNYSANVAYSGDVKYGATEKTIKLEVQRITTTLDNIVVKSNVTVPVISVMLPSDAGGNLIVNITGNVYTGKIVNGNCSVEITGLNPGNYTALVSYSGDNNYTNAHKTVNLEVPKVTVTLNDNNCKWNASQIAVSINNATGTLTVEIANKTYVKELVDGRAVVDINLNPGSYDVKIIYSGDSFYTGAEKAITLEIPKIKVDLGDSLTVNSTNVGLDLDEDASGNITVVVSGKSYTKELINGKATVDVSGLYPGIYNATVIYSGDGKYDSATKIVNVNVPKVAAELDNDTLAVDGQNGSSSISINLPEDATGTLSVTVDGKTYTENLVNGKATVNIPELADGEYNMTVTYSGDSRYDGITKTTVVNVNNTVIDNSTNTTVVKADPVLIISAGDVSVGEIVVVNVRTSVEIGKLVVNVNNVDYELVISNGESSVSISDLAVGNYTVVARFAGDDKFNEATNSTRFSVLKVNVPVTNETISIPESDTTEYSVSLPSDATGTLTVTVDGKVYSETLVNGKATVNIPELSEGSHNITVSYSGDSKYSPIIKSSVVVKNPANSTGGNNTGNATDDNNSTSGNNTNQSVSIPDEALSIPESGSDYSISLPSDATGTLTVTVDGVPYTQKLVNGKATVSIPKLSEGSHNITVTYSGDSKYASITKSSVVVKEHVPVIKLTASNLSMLYTSGKYFKVRLTSDGKALPNQKVKITINGKTYTRTTDKNGYASLKISLPPKAYTVKVTYGNLTITKKVTVKSIISAKNINAKKSSKSIKIKVTLKKVNKKYLKNKKVTLKFNKKTFKAKTNKKGVATFTIKNSVYKKLKTNKKYAYQVIYGKDKVKKTIKFKK